MLCKYCDDPLPANARFCVTCGRAVGHTATTGATERLGDNVLYVTQEEYDNLLCDAFTYVVGPFLTDDRLVFNRGRRIMVREE